MKLINYTGNNLEGVTKCESDKMIKGQWNFKYHFGCIYVEGWGKPSLVLCCNDYSDYGQSWGYGYEQTGINFDTEEECKQGAMELNDRYNLPRYFNFAVYVKDIDLNLIPA